jgi:hypothetical protein
MMEEFPVFQPEIIDGIDSTPWLVEVIWTFDD